MSLLAHLCCGEETEYKWCPIIRQPGHPEPPSSPASHAQLGRETLNYRCQTHKATCDWKEMGKDHPCHLFINSDDTLEETAARLQRGSKKAMNYLLVQLVDMGEEWWGL